MIARICRELGLCLLPLSLLAPAVAHASVSTNVKITELITLKGGVMLFRVSAAKSGNPACDVVQRWAVAANTTSGQALGSTVLSAYMAGRTVTVVGTTNACTVWGDSEDVDYVVVGQN